MTRFIQGKELEELFKRLNTLPNEEEWRKEMDKLGDVVLVGCTGERRGEIVG